MWRGPATVTVTMNRDERWGRAPEIPPTIHRGGAAQVAWIAPADGERGGTWMGVNDRGVVACLLNGYTAEDLPLLGRDDVPSRGAIVPEVLSRAPGDAWTWLSDELDPSPYPSFTLLVISPSDAVELRWRRGERPRLRPLDPGWTMVSSSFWRTDEVLAWRQAEFERWRDEGAPHRDGVPQFNLLEQPGWREWSPFMTRPMSATRSLTNARVDPESGHASLRWWPRDGDRSVNPARPRGELELSLRTARENAS